MMWIITEDVDDIVIDCATPPTCWFDGTQPKLMTSKLMNFDLVPGSGKRDAHAIDMEFRCQVCGWWDIFGVPIHKRQYEKLHEMLTGGPTVREEEIGCGLITGMMINPDCLGSDMSKAWEETNDLRGHQPKFDVLCYHCKQNGHDERLFFRYSYFAEKGDETEKVYGRLNQLEYKCKKCEWTTKFLVEADSDYIDKIMTNREKAGYHRNLYYLPPDEWSEDEEIKKKLESLGYW